MAMRLLRKLMKAQLPKTCIIFKGRKFCPNAGMPLNIKGPNTENVVLELAVVTGEGVTTAVQKAAEEQLQRVQRYKSGRRLTAEMLNIGDRCSALPDLNAKSADEILGYDEHGLPG